MQYRNYSDEDVIYNATKVKSIAGLLKSIGLKPSGGNYSHMKKTLQRLEINTDHWTGQAWNKGEQVKDWSSYSRANRCKPHLIRLRGHKCENCLLELWLNQPIPLDVHHLDKNKTNNSYENLQLVCPNCHAQTDNYKNRKCLTNFKN